MEQHTALVGVVGINSGAVGCGWSQHSSQYNAA